MKRHYLFIGLVIFFVTSLRAQENVFPFVQFQVTREKEVEADVAIIRVGIKKKDKNFSVASKENLKILHRLIEVLKQYGIKEQDIVQRKWGNFPDPSIWGREYVICTYLDIKIRDKDKFYPVIKIVSEADPQITINSIDFDCDNKDSIYRELFKSAIENLKEKEKLYENAFTVQLKLFSLEENFLPINFSSEISQVQKENPVIKMRLILNARYRIMN